LSLLKNKQSKNHTHFTYLIKGTVWRRASWGC